MTKNPLSTDILPVTDDARKINNCWNHIGVWAESGATCERLSDAIHCRNCEMFIAAGRLIFERESTLEYQQENLAVFAACEPVVEGESAVVIVFRLGVELFALPTSVLEVITDSKPVHRLPHMKSSHIKGVVNISGEICLCHSLMAVLDVDACIEKGESAGRHVYVRLIVVRINNARYVFPVDEIKGMTDFQVASLRVAPATITDKVKQLVNGAFKYEGQDVAVLDADKLYRLLNNGLL